MDSSSQLSVDYFDSQISTLTEPMFPPTSDISSVPPTSTVASSSLSSSSEAPPMPSSPADVDFRSVASVIEKARRAVAMAAPFIVADESGEVAALLEAFLEKAPVFRDAFEGAAIEAPSEVEVTCREVVPEEFSIEEKSAASWLLEQTTFSRGV